MFTMQYTKDGGKAVAMAMLLPPPTKPLTRSNSVVLAGYEKKEEYAKPRTKGRAVNYRKIGLTLRL